MKTKLLFFFLTSLLTFSILSLSKAQDNSVVPERWNIDVRSLPPVDNNSTLQYTPLPVEETFLEQPPTIRYDYTPNGVFAISSSSRILPRTSTQSEVTITRHPLNPNILFASANVYPVYGGKFSEGVYVSTNGGLTWTGKDSCTGAPTDAHVGDPGITIDKNGTFIMTHIRYNYATNSITGMDANYSINNGATWSNSVTLLSGSQDKNLAATDDASVSAYYGRSYCVWSRFTAALPPITISYTDNGGVSWSAADDINVSPANHYSQGADIRVGRNGEVYVCWANPNTAAANVEDYCGFAKSINGGVTWTINDNNIFDMNGIRGTLPTVNNIRVNSFPRIDVDRTCGPRGGWVYIVVSQKNLSPAGSDPDIILHRSTNNGTTWSSGIRVNQDALNNGKIQYFPCVRVDESGGLNIFYYDNRNTAAPVMQNYLSRSTDGGVTFTDVKITNHNFTPSPISGTAGGYQGDYIGITSGGLGKIFCNWMDNSSGIYQSWIASVDITKSNICEDFACSNFNPTLNFYEEYSGTNRWSRQSPTAYGIGITGSARFNSFTASAGTIQSLTSYQFTAAPANTYLTFDNAYAPWTGGLVDSLIIETSANGGVTYGVLAKLWGGLGAAAGPLNTVFVGGGQFTPANSQWAPKIFLLPVGTNKVKLRGRSGSGNDIWLDNICVQTLPAPSATSSIGVLPEGFYRTPPPQTIRDTVRVYLHRTDFPKIKVDSAVSYLTTGAIANSPFTRALSGTYYIIVKHRNSIETWSNAGGELYTRGSFLSYNFIQPVNQAYNNNQALVDPFPYYGMFGGDVDRDNAVDLADLSIIENAAVNFASGYVIPDLTGDNFVDVNDQAIADNNSFNFVIRQAPPGAEPVPAPAVVYDSKDLIFENDAMKQKQELTIKLLKEKETQRIAAQKKNELSKEFKQTQKDRMKNRAKVNSPETPILNDKNNSTNENNNSGIRFGEE
ncbi:MAG: glycoside hydrolase [Bacteroidota bacterium]|nr:glycoside hydrolase [Bacteroidota bacterium]